MVKARCGGVDCTCGDVDCRPNVTCRLLFLQTKVWAFYGLGAHR